MRRRTADGPSEAQYLTRQLFAAFGTLVGEGRTVGSRWPIYPRLIFRRTIPACKSSVTALAKMTGAESIQIP